MKDQSNIGWNNFILGRWFEQWQQVQQRFIKKSRSKRSYLEWSTCIINKFMNMVWDLWNFRNGLVHGKGGVKDRAIHKELSSQIRQQFTIGFVDLLTADRRLYRSISCSGLIDSTRETKQNWIRNINAARLAVDLDDEDDDETVEQQTQTLIEDFCCCFWSRNNLTTIFKINSSSSFPIAWDGSNDHGRNS